MKLFLVQNCMFHISCIITFLFIIVPVLELRVHHLYLFPNQAFNFVFESVAFTRITMCTEQEISFRIIATSSRYLLRKMWIEVLWILHFVVYFSSEAMLKACQSIVQPKSKSMPKFKWQWNMHQFEGVQWRKRFRGYRNKLQNQIKN